jgi:hypothetical protein
MFLMLQEDEILRKRIKSYGLNNWGMVADGLPGRSGKSCSERCALRSSTHIHSVYSHAAGTASTQPVQPAHSNTHGPCSAHTAKAADGTRCGSNWPKPNTLSSSGFLKPLAGPSSTPYTPLCLLNPTAITVSTPPVSSPPPQVAHLPDAWSEAAHPGALQRI